MARADKLRKDFCDCQNEFAYRDFERLLRSLGYEELATRGSGGSRRRFVHTKTKHIIMLHEPHDGIMGPGMVKEKRQDLRDAGTLL